ncbi:hypothetical protein LXA43DRAFT_837960, partial [Ganoderma leucocontextum]
VPVCLGPAIPRSDRADELEHFCRVMLVLFRPWRCTDNLRNDGETWEAAFTRQCCLLSAETLAIIDNMALLTECKDRRDA